jgi:hypothetical protein
MKIRHLLVVLLPLALSACASVEPYPGVTPGRTAEEKAALYRNFAMQKDSDGDYHAQGQVFRAPLPVMRYQHEVAPELIPTSFEHDLFGWKGWAWLGAWAGTMVWAQQLKSGAPELGLVAALNSAMTVGMLSYYFGHFEQGVDRMTQRWDQALAKELDQPEPVWPLRETRYVDTLPGFKVGLGFSTTYHSGLDHQDEFTPPSGIFNGRYQDAWTDGGYLSFGYTFKQAWTLEADWEAVGSPWAWAHLGSTDTDLELKQRFYYMGLRAGRAWDWRFDGPLDLSLMPFAGYGSGLMSGEMTEKDSTGARIGHYRLDAGGLAGVAGLRLAVSETKHLASTVELGYRWLRLDNARVEDADGSFAGRNSPEQTQHDTTAYWDLSGPYLKFGLLFL